MDEQNFKKINRLRKECNLSEAWEIGCLAVQASPQDQYLKGAFFWVCYDYLKEVQSQIKAKASSGNGDFSPSPQQIERINFLMDWIIWLDNPTGGYEYRSLALCFQKNLEHFPKLVHLLARRLSGLFLEEDKEPFLTEKGESPSLMLKFSRKVAKCWLTHEECRQLPIEELCALFDRTRREVKDNAHLIWLDYDEAKCLIRAGCMEKARECALNVLKKKQNESWAWGALAATYRKESPETSIVLFSKALMCAHNDVFALPTLKGFAALLAANGFSDEASMCLKRAVNCYAENGWNIKADLEKLINQDWYNPEVELDALQFFLKHKSSTALDYLHGETEKVVGIVLNLHGSGKGFHVYINKDKSVSVRLGIYRSKEKPSQGDYIELTLATDDGSVVAANPTEATDLEDVGYIEGKFKVNERGFGFIEDTYVPKHLADPSLAGQAVVALRILDFDKSKSRHNWKALTLQKADSQ